MSTACHVILREVAVRCNALFGTDAVELQTTYATLPLTDAVFVSSIFPMAACIDACVNAEQKLAGAIALSADKTKRAYLRGISDPLDSGDALPSLDADGNPFIGNFGAVLDGANQARTLTRRPVALIQNRLLSPNIYLVPVYQYAISSGMLLHTRTTAIMEGCVYNTATQTAAYNNNENMLLPDDLGEAIVQGALAMLVRDDEFVQQSTQYANFFATQLASIPPAVMEVQAI